MTTSTKIATGAKALVAAAVLIGAGAAPASATTAPSSLSLASSAYGSTAKVGPVSSGKTASFSACATAPGATYGNQVGVVDLGGTLGKVGAVVTKGQRTGDSITTTSTVGETSLLGGLIKVKALESRSTTSVAGGVISSTGSSTITGLTIAGLPTTVSRRRTARSTSPGWPG